MFLNWLLLVCTATGVPIGHHIRPCPPIGPFRFTFCLHSLVLKICLGPTHTQICYTVVLTQQPSQKHIFFIEMSIVGDVRRAKITIAAMQLFPFPPALVGPLKRAVSLPKKT